MFYCDQCAEKRSWPISIFRSLGPCEMCQKTRDCSDTPSKYLPIPKEDS